jgi:hypothetical protein
MSDTHEETIDQLREKADEAAKLTQQNRAQSAEIAMLKAGIPTGSKVGQAFVREYDGELDPATIKEAAVEWGLWQPEGSDAKPEPDATAADRDKLKMGGNPSDGDAPKPHPAEAALETMRQDMKSGLPTETSRIKAVAGIIGAAIDGDERVLIKTPGGVERTKDTEGIPFQSGRRGLDG